MQDYCDMTNVESVQNINGKDLTEAIDRVREFQKYQNTNKLQYKPYSATKRVVVNLVDDNM